MPLPLLAAAGIGAAGSIGAGIANFFGQQSANETNWDMFVSNQAFNQANINSAREYDYNMQNSAVQRRRADMEKAGINPMLAAGDAAGTGTPPITNAGSGPPAQNTMSGMSPAIANALQAVSIANDLKTADSERTLKGAQAAAAISQSNRENSTAALNAKQGKVLDATFGATKAKADTEESGAIIDKQYQSTKKLLEIISQGSGIARDSGFAIESILNAAQPGKGVLKKILPMMK